MAFGIACPPGQDGPSSRRAATRAATACRPDAAPNGGAVSPSSPRARAVGRVRDRRTFGALRRDGTRHRSGPVTVTALRDPAAGGARVAYAVSKAVGGAVERNRLRRRLRAIVHATDLDAGVYLVSAAPAAASLPHAELAAHVEAACRP